MPKAETVKTKECIAHFTLKHGQLTDEEICRRLSKVDEGYYEAAEAINSGEVDKASIAKIMKVEPVFAEWYYKTYLREAG